MDTTQKKTIEKNAKCFACRQVEHEHRWPAFVFGLTFGIIDSRRNLDEVWQRHQDLIAAL